MNLYEKFNDLRAHSGVGVCLYAQNETGYYSIFMPLETAPSVMSTPSSIDIDVTSSDEITKIEGKMTLEEKEVEFLLHRDNLRRLKQYSDMGIINFMVVNHDYTAIKFSATVSYIQNDATSGDPLRGTIKITPVQSDGFVDNAYDLIQPTAKFTTGIAPTIKLDATENASKTLTVTCEPADATITATSENDTICTADYEGQKLTIARVAKGSAIVTLKAESEGYASWTTTIHVACE